MVDITLKVPAIEKLLDYIVSGIGAIGGPMLSRWKASAAADALRIEAQGRADALRIGAQSHTDTIHLIGDAQAEARNNFASTSSSIEGELNIRKEIESRLTFQERKRQGNIRAVVKMAAEELDGKEVADNDVDHDWVARFFADVQDVTSEQMQRIWAKILAGEVETPGRTSLHTLAILKNMTQHDAKLFEGASRFVFDTFILKEEKYVGAIHGFPTHDIFLQLQSYGLLSVSTGLKVTISLLSQEPFTIRNSGQIYRISKTSVERTRDAHIPCHVLTPQGLDLYRINESTISEDYLSALAWFLNEAGSFKLEYARVIGDFGGTVRHGEWTLIEPRVSRQRRP